MAGCAVSARAKPGTEAVILAALDVLTAARIREVLDQHEVALARGVMVRLLERRAEIDRPI